MAERRLLNAEPGGGPREMSLFGDGNKEAQMTQIHRSTISGKRPRYWRHYG